jgi:transposase
MTDTQHVTTDPLQATQSLCPKCGSQMGLTRIEPDSPGKDSRTFECGQCQHIETMVIIFA